MQIKTLLRDPLLIFSALLALMIPVWKAPLALLAGLLTITYLFSGSWKQRWNLMKSSPSALSLVVFYLMNFAGIFWTEHFDKGWMHLEIKLSFLLFPWIIFARPDLTTQKVTWLKQLFMAGASLGAIGLLIRASYVYISSGENQFTYALFGAGFHPSYLSMYYLLAIWMLFDETYKRHGFQKQIAIGMMALLAACVLLLSSKINLLILAFTGVFLFFRAWRRAKSKTPLILIFSGLTASVFILLLLNPGITERLSKSVEVLGHVNHIDKSDTESNAARILIWQSAVELIRQNPMGVGVGDVNIELEKQYHRDGFAGIEAKKLNAHNQFLQTGVALGFAGIMLLFLVFAIPSYLAIKAKDHLLGYFLLLCFINALVEGIFETQTGILFFGFFFCLLIKQEHHEPAS